MLQIPKKLYLCTELKLFDYFMATKTKENHVRGFFLRATGKKVMGNLYYRFNREGVSLTICTGISVNVKKWRTATQSTAKWSAYEEDDEGKRVKKLMDDVIGAVGDVIKAIRERRGLSAKQSTDKKHKEKITITGAERKDFQIAVDNIVKKESFERNKEADTNNLNHILSFYEYFVKGIKKGVIKYKNGGEYQEATIKVWEGFKKILYGVVDPNMTFDQIDKHFVDDFNYYLGKVGLMANSKNLYVSCMRKLCSTAVEYEYNHNVMSLSLWKKNTVKKEDKKAAIYLTDEEIDALYEMPLKGNLSTIRDMFFIGCMTCQRYSDYSQIQKWEFINNIDGVPIISLTQKKTKAEVKIPIVDDRVKIVCERNNYKFPAIKGKIDVELRRIFKKLAETVPSLTELYETTLTKPEKQAEENYMRIQKKKERGEQLTKQEYSSDWQYRELCDCPDNEHLWLRDENGKVLKPKYALISTHTARRSGITNLYNLGVLDNRELRSISGHQSDQTLDIYIKTSASEQSTKVFNKLMKKKGGSNPDGKAEIIDMKKVAK